MALWATMPKEVTQVTQTIKAKILCRSKRFATDRECAGSRGYTVNKVTQAIEVIKVIVATEVINVMEVLCY